MPGCRCALAPLALIAVLAGCVNPPSAPAPATAGTGPTAAVVGDHPEQALKKGMTADQVRQIMGAPAEIKPKPAPTGNAEVWVYRRTVLGPPQQVQVGTKPISVVAKDADGIYRSRVVQEEPIYRQVHDRITETVLLLMFDGQLVEQGLTSQRQQEFE
jgi:hypothetical protein